MKLLIYLILWFMIGLGNVLWAGNFDKRNGHNGAPITTLFTLGPIGTAICLLMESVMFFSSHDSPLKPIYDITNKND